MAMDYRSQQRDPTRHLLGITTVVLIHAVLIYALLTGLVRTAVEIVKKPLTATIVKEAPPPPPPPPPPKRIELPKPPPAYVPPPDVAPPPSIDTGPTISAVTSAPPAAAAAAPVAAPAPPPPPPPPKPAVRRGVTPVYQEEMVYPRAAIRAGVEKGRVLARVSIDEKGIVTDVTIVSAEPPKYFEQTVIDGLKAWKFKAEGEKYVAEVEVNFKLQ